MKKYIGYTLALIGMSFGIGWICHRSYPNFDPVIIFFPLIILGTILQWN